MNEPIVDARGKLCPQPLIMTKKTLRDLPLGGSMTVLIDNATSVENVQRFLKDNGCPVTQTVNHGVYSLHVTKSQETLISSEAEQYCPTTPPATGAHVICIKGEQMGTGADELGLLLMKAFVNTIKEIKPLPGKIIFYNRGIFLALDDSPVLPAFKELEAQGVKIISCGTCLDYYQAKSRLSVGTVTNMYAILEELTSASHVIYP
jgi:selenium metabolism protein YedF